MQEVKKPRKPLIYYYVIVLAVLLLFNFLFMPWAAERQVQEVGYDTFIEMTEKRRSVRFRLTRRIMKSSLQIKRAIRSIRPEWWKIRG